MAGIRPSRLWIPHHFLELKSLCQLGKLATIQSAWLYCEKSKTSFQWVAEGFQCAAKTASSDVERMGTHY